jgi:signal transduction histidine kinase
MRPLTLRARIVLGTAVLALFLLGAGYAQRLQSVAQAELAQSFEQDLGTLLKLPRLRARLRRVDLLTDQYLLTGNPRWLRSRQAALGQVRAAVDDLRPRLENARSRRLLDRLDAELGAYLAQQDQWISRREAGRLSPADSAKIVGRERPFQDLVESIMAIQVADHERLESVRTEARRASRQAVGVFVAAGILAVLAMAWLLSRYVVEPVTALETYSRDWRLGRPWVFEPGAASAEVRGLSDCIEEMAARLNAQFRREHELVEIKTRLVALVSHEFNNALNVIQGITTVLQETEDKPDQAKRTQYYSMVQANVRHLAFAATNLLNVARLQSGRFALRPVQTDLKELLDDAVRRLSLLAENKELDVAVEAPDPCPAAAGDPEALTLVVTNLLSNAIKYTPPRGRVRLGLSPEPGPPGQLRCWVEDTGIGMSKDEAKSLFSEFYRTEGARREARGFGVGLSLAQKIVEAHGSTLEVASEPGKGSRFSFALPLWNEDAPARRLPGGRTAHGRLTNS